MAARQAKPVKQLKEHLREKQDPFILDLYLVERGYLTNKFNARKSFQFQGSVTCSKVLRAVCSRFRIRSSGNRIGNHLSKERNSHETAELDRFSSASSSTLFNSCSTNGSDAEETSNSHQKDHHSSKDYTPDHSFLLCNPTQKEAVTDRKRRWQCIEESKQLSPISVLEEAASYSHAAFPLPTNKTKGLSVIREADSSNSSCVLFPEKVTDDSILSASLWKVLFQTADEKKKSTTLPGVSEIRELNNVSSECLKSKKTCLQQSRKLLFDCVREIVEKQERKRQLRGYLSSEALGELVVGDKVKCWGKQCREEESTLTELLRADVISSAQEWSSFESQRRKIGLEIEDAIFEEIVKDMIEIP